MAEISTKPYLIRALYEWCGDSGYTPYIAVHVDDRTKVPREFVKNSEIVLNISAIATHRLVIDNEAIAFQARFGGVARELWVPIENVVSIYARETGHGMAFEVTAPTQPTAPNFERPTLISVGPSTSEHSAEVEPASITPDVDPEPPVPAGRGRLKRVK